MLVNDFTISKESDDLLTEISRAESARGEEMKEVGINLPFLKNMKKFKLFKADTCQICDI